eukprot:145740-Ditylum_brightwellii.AAC.1
MGVTQKYDEATGKFVDGYQPSPPRTRSRQNNVDKTLLATSPVGPCCACCPIASRTSLTPNHPWGQDPKTHTQSSRGWTCQQKSVVFLRCGTPEHRTPRTHSTQICLDKSLFPPVELRRMPKIAVKNLFGV